MFVIYILMILIILGQHTLVQYLWFLIDFTISEFFCFRIRLIEGLNRPEGITDKEYAIACKHADDINGYMESKHLREAEIIKNKSIFRLKDYYESE